MFSARNLSLSLSLALDLPNSNNPNMPILRQPPSRVSVSSVNFWNIRGTSATKTAVSLMCSSANPCRDVDLRDVDISYVAGDKPVCEFSNVSPISSGDMKPACSH